MDIAKSIDANLAPWPHAWDDLKASDFLHFEADKVTLPLYIDAVSRYAVRSHNALNLRTVKL